MKVKIYLYSILIFFISSCGYRKIRVGYEAKKYPQTVENIPIYHSTYGYERSSNIEILGTMKLWDTGFTTNCHEDDAHLLLRKEASTLNADLIIIYDEERPDKKSTCYRCTANFIKIINPDEEIEFEAKTQTNSLEDRVKQDKKGIRNRNATAAALGFFGGFFSTILLLSR